MDRLASYEEDIHAWSQEQARILRDLARSGVRLPNDLDLHNVAEEIEEVGNEQRFAVESNLVQALVHLIKLVALPGDDAVRGWIKETNAFLDTAAARYRPSMRRMIDEERLWARACRLATRDLEVDGQGVPDLPVAPPFALDELVDERAEARALAARLAAVLGRPET